MLIKHAVLQRIASGEVDTLYRKQKRPTVKVGGTLRTQIGVLDILAVDAIDIADIAERDAERAGFASIDEVTASLAAKAEGTIYRVRVGLGGPDPRIALRESDRLTDAELDDITTRLGRIDRASARGAWTLTVMRLLDEHPHVRAPELADSLGLETAPFKNDVRKLKELGLTISFSPGYELSPRGRAVLLHLEQGCDGPAGTT